MTAVAFALLIAFAILRPPLFIYWAIGLGVGLLFQFLLRQYKSRHHRPRPILESSGRSWGFNPIEILIVVVVVAVIGLLMFHGLSNRIPGLAGFDVHYRAQITLTEGHWNIEEGLVVPGKELANIDEKLLVACGWQTLGTADANTLFTRRRSQPAFTQWWPAYSVQVIHFPQPD